MLFDVRRMGLHDPCGGAQCADLEEFLMRVPLKHPSVGAASSHFALRAMKYETALPVSVAAPT